MYFSTLISAANGVIAEASERQKAEDMFNESLTGLPEDEKTKRIVERAAMKEKARLEAIEERRHQQLCSAIRSTSFWAL